MTDRRPQEQVWKTEEAQEGPRGPACLESVQVHCKEKPRHKDKPYFSNLIKVALELGTPELKRIALLTWEEILLAT